MNIERVIYLYQRYQAQRLTEAERSEWEATLSDPFYEQALQQLTEADWQAAKAAAGSLANNQPEQEQIYRYIIGQQQQRSKHIGWRQWLTYAAAVLLTLTVGILLWENGVYEEPQTAAPVVITPGGNKAILTLSDGSVINLRADQDGIVMTGNAIHYSNGGEVISQADPGLAEPKILSLLVPKGGTYQVTLPDGSKVWLNAESTLQYPSRFERALRTVQLAGEAYFEITTDSRRPFRVVTKTQHVDVLGTQFNVTAYDNETAVKTTLVEGSVKVINLQAGTGKLLKPGQQSIVMNNNTEIADVNTEIFTAWKDGYFNFESTPFPEVIEQLARWYDIDIEYRQKPQKKFSGRMKRDVQLTTVLNFLKDLGIPFRMEGHKLIIG